MQTQLNVWLPESSPAFRFRATAKSPSAMGALAILALVVGLAGCSVGSEGLPPGLPGLTGGAGTLSIITLTMPDGIVNRTYNRVVSTQGGTAPFTCINTTAMPAGLTLTTSGTTCVVSGTPTAIGPAPFSIQVSDSSLPTVRKSVSYNYNVRGEYAITSVPVMPDGVVGRTYGVAPQTPPTAMTSVSATVGGGALASCTVTGAGGNALVGTVVGGANCAASAASLSAGGSFPNVTFTVTDTAITDPANAATIIVPSRTISMTTGLIVQLELVDVASLNPLPDAVVGRTYGAPRAVASYTVSNGLTSRIVTAGITAMPAGTNLACSAPGTVVTCGSGGAAVVGAPGAFTFTMTASDAGNTATPAGSFTTDSNGNTTHTINVDAAFTLSNPIGGLGNGTEGRAFNATPLFTYSGGLPATQAGVMCANGTGVPAGLNAGTGVNVCALTGTPGGGTSAGSPYNVVLTVTDLGNLTTPPPAAPAASPGTPLTINAPLVLNGGAAIVFPASTVNQPYAPLDIPFTGGNGPNFICTDVGGQLPANMTVARVGTNCRVSGTPTSTANRTITIQVTDTASTSTAAGMTSQAGNLTINTGVSFVTTSPLPAGTVGRAFTVNLAATGGTLPYTFSPAGMLNGGAGACAGLTMAANGKITGTPTTSAGSPCVVMLTVTDSTAAMSTQSFSITINPALMVPAFVLGNGVQGRAFNQNVPFTGGNGPFTCTAPALPAPLTITASAGASPCVISGTPGATFGPTNIVVTVTDTATGSTAAGNANNNSNLTINAPLTITTAAVPDAVASRAYNFMLVATGGTGMAPAFTWANPGGSGVSLNTGTAACAGLKLNPASGVITGPASATSGACAFMVNVSDQSTASTAGITTANSNFNLTVQPALAVTTVQAQIFNGLLNNPYTGLTFTATGGIGAKTWVAPGVTMAPCAAPTGSIDGLALSAGGVLSGTPAAASLAPNGFPFQVCVFDVGNAATPPGSATGSFTFDVMKNLAYAAGAGALNSVEVINTSTNVLVTTIALGAGASPNGVAITPNGRFAIVAQNGTNKISVIDTILNAQIAGSPVAIPAASNCGKPAGVGVSPDGINVYVACDDTTGTNVEEVIVLSAAALTSAPATAFPPTATIVTGVGSKPDAIAFRDATRGYVTLSGSNKLAIINNTGVPVQVGLSFSLTAGRATPVEVTVLPNAAKFYAYISKENIAGIGAVDVVDVTSDALSIVTSVDTGNNTKPFGVAGVPGTNARVYVALDGSNQYTVFDNTVVTPVIAAAAPALPYFVPDPTAGAGSGVPVGVAIPPLGTVPAGGLPVFITLSGTDGVAVVNNAAALTKVNAKNASSPIAVTATSGPALIRAIPVPK